MCDSLAVTVSLQVHVFCTVGPHLVAPFGGGVIKLSGSSSLLSLQYEVVIYKRVGLIHSSPASQAACKGELDTPTRRRGWAARGRSLWSQPALSVPAWALWFQLQPQAPAVQWQAAPSALSSRLRWTVPLKVWGWLNNPPSLALLLLGMLSHWNTLGKKLTVWTCTGLENEHTIVTHDVICTPLSTYIMINTLSLCAYTSSYKIHSSKLCFVLNFLEYTCCIKNTFI